ncbi:MAG: hypothetical protein AAGA80_23305 [Cyanobacteria bacterium P01_F01_bin.143]
MNKILFFLLVICGSFGLYNCSSDKVAIGSGLMVSETPRQEKINSPASFQIEEYTITEIATFDIKAKVLSKKNYRIGREADLSPTDLALGWGKMSDDSILKKVRISQSNRWYWWRVDSFPIPRRAIETQSANMHLIPASDSVKNAISKVRKGDIIEISGSLVNVRSNDGWRWTSSQTRNDTGDGACELIWVESLRIVTL